MANVGLSSKFAREWANLPRGVQKSVSNVYDKLLKGVSGCGLNLEAVRGAGAASIKSIRVNDNYRIILHLDGKGQPTLLHIDTHDAAYQWAARNRFGVNPKTGEVQLYVVDVPEVKGGTQGKQEAAGAVGTGSAVEGTEGKAKAGPFARDPSDEDLLRLGVPEEQLTLVRSLRDDEDILRHEDLFPAGVFNALLLAHDGWKTEDIIKELGFSKSKETADDIAKAVAASEVSQGSFAFVSTEAEVNAVRQAGLAQWRIFLHPSQRRIVQKNANGPMKVLGGAGTGKTVVAMHRAKYLLENVFRKPTERILFTTYTRNLCDDIHSLLKTICTEEQMKRIDVCNLDRWAFDYAKRQGIDVRPILEKEKSEYMEEAKQGIADAEKWSVAFLLRERAQVVLANEVGSLPAYLRVSRAGQGVRLSAAQKKTVWSILEAYRLILVNKKLTDFDELALLVANQVRHEGAAPYASVIVDEAQDFGASALRLVAALSGNTLENSRPNSLLIVGDAHQRIYRKKAVLSRCGIDIRGRSSKLRLNYRTTEKIRKRAIAILTGIVADDLDGGTDDNKNFHSLVVGEKPEEMRFQTFEQEMDAIVEKIKEWQKADGRNLSDYAILARQQNAVDEIKKALKVRGLECCIVTQEESRRATDVNSVRIATMHRAKGLEFAGVVVAELNEGVWPHRLKNYAELDSISQAASDDAERCLLYVAISRAMNHVFLTGVGGSPAALLVGTKDLAVRGGVE